MDKYAIILAAGKGSRMKSKRDDISKVSFPILGQPLVKYVINALKPIGFKEMVAVVGFGGKTSEQIVKDECKVVWQNEQKGSGHAVMMANGELEGKEGETIVCCGDTPLLTTATLSFLFECHEKEHNSLTVMTSILEDPFGYGRIYKENGCVTKIIEQKDCSEEEKKINEVNAGVYVFDNKELFEALKHITTNNAAGEYYLTDVISLFAKKGLKVGSYAVKDVDETLGVNDRYQLSVAAKILQRRINKALMVSGVSIEDPENTYIAPSVKIGADSIIKPGCYIMGDTTIGEENVIGPNTYLENVVIGDLNEIVYSHLADTKVGNKTTLGPYLRTRKNVVIADEAHIGNFNELKNVNFGDGSKCAHLSYLGDANIGAHVNVGCGTIIANYDGVNKFHSDIGDNVFLGSGSTIISPIKVGDGAFIAAGSTINEDIPSGDMAIARSRQTNKPGYAKVLHEKALSKKNNK
ncbi:MAG: bifunctional UDP-N-acetylglucosamine diphosphorylase/glucosamine-1-phosphate N-acetyltransferase GlmU [Bacilli bacterium]|nr:bifunctional UDP-N-acetylglucosamine diphosphorylase/glucosamine-1-phosphate N-acetyltransferase GlmU [Bacilli bacterium]MCH4210400.1 bifunctional UDP-N-acetylglucosamine diphosphorylase/glucosamine-1-phosphate N-acetyltransferase GlmU [Bacilli bacterium]MCH4228924.1 bifunctional UDP-N-acetylglucosamine diphosphorylase/glucosamine-1-phosphate N-acetyltransferase GlmU [Bacilli bacterium]MCH4277550.1 bifunctional UDP-N-acetylglucosamine diphosphorylase/glucosamine-1-phosphate N-acetyltransferas